MWKPRPRAMTAALVLLCLLCPCVPVLAAPLSLSGTVRDGEGQPVAGAEVWVTQDRRVRRTRTDEAGRFGVADLSVAPTELVVLKEGHALAGSTGLLTQNRDLELVLTPAATLPLRVTNREFVPVPGARVRSMVVSDTFSVPVEDLVPEGFPSLRTNDMGELDIPAVPPGGFVKLVMAHIKYADSSVAYLPVQDRRRDIQLYEGIPVRGRVSGVDGAGVAAARVSIFQTGIEGQREAAEVLTDPEGFYNTRVPDGPYWMTARHPDHASPAPVSVDVKEGGAVQDLAMLAPRDLEGRVLLPDKNPCPGMRLGYRVGGVLYEETFTDDRGAFRLRVGVPDGELLLAPPPGFRTEDLPRIPVQFGDAMNVRLPDIRLKELPRFAGRAVLPEGTPEEGRVIVTSLDLPSPVRFLSNPEGRFEIRLDYQPDQNTVTFRAEHTLRFLRKDFTVRMDQTGGVEITLEPFDPDLSERPADLARNNLSPLLGKPAPAVECSDWFNTQPLSLDALRGKVVVLHFWGGFDNSPFAMAQLAELRAVYDAYQGAGDVLVLGIHDASSEADEIQEYLGRLDVRFPVGRDADPFVTFTGYGIVAIPHTVLLDKKGEPRFYQTEGRLLELIKALRRE